MQPQDAAVAGVVGVDVGAVWEKAPKAGLSREIRDRSVEVHRVGRMAWREVGRFWS